jgi:chromate transporter
LDVDGIDDHDSENSGEPRDERGRSPVGLAPVLGYFLRLGTIGFGGPIATVGYMQRDLVERRGWMDRKDFLDGVALGRPCPDRWPPKSPCGSGTCGVAGPGP